MSFNTGRSSGGRHAFAVASGIRRDSGRASIAAKTTSGGAQKGLRQPIDLASF
jgi:hypothetical protein